MNILHTIDSLAPATGGTASCTLELLRGLNAAGLRSRILTLRAPQETLPQDSFVRSLPDDTISPLRVSPHMRRALHRSRAQLYHTHGLWRDTNHATCRLAYRRGVPCVVSLHGMLYPTALAYSKRSKQLLMLLGQRRDLQHCSCLHVTSEEERQFLRKLRLSRPTALIPPPVAIPDYLPSIIRPTRKIFRVGYLGRLHPIKNIDGLIRSWAALRLPSAELLIIGRGNPEYCAGLRQLVRSTRAPHVRFVDFVQGRDKYELLASLDVLCAPSHQENFGMSIAEALLVGTPVIASRHTPWQVLQDEGCGLRVPTGDSALSEALLELYCRSADERAAMGKIGAELIRRKFSPAVICRQMIRLYRYLLALDSKPDFFYE